MPRLPEDADEDAVQARKDAIDLSRYQERDGMSEEEARVATTSARLTDAVRVGCFDWVEELAVVGSLSDDELDGIRAGGIPRFEPTKRREVSAFNLCDAGGGVHFDRTESALSILELLQSDETVQDNAKMLAFLRDVPPERKETIRLYSDKEAGNIGRWNNELRKGNNGHLSPEDAAQEKTLNEILDAAPPSTPSP